MSGLQTLIDCNTAADGVGMNDGETSSTIPALLEAIGHLEEEKAYLRMMLCELLRKNERLREEAERSASRPPSIPSARPPSRLLPLARSLDTLGDARWA